ncbi:MAG: aminoacyl-tRNA hydrolase [Pseudomonadota bacterium]
MRLIVGLGNPGKKYAQNRHNIGFLALEHIAKEHGLPDWRSKFQGHIAEGNFGGQKTLLLMPTTFMNVSGQSVQAAAKFYKIDAKDIIVLHDELDLPPGKVKMKQGGGHAGHNGLRSITQHIGAEFWRLRIGIGHPGDKSRVSGYVLSDFAKADHDWIDTVLPAISKNLDPLVNFDAAKFIQSLGPSKTAKPAPQKSIKPKAPPPEPEEDARGPLQKLLDKFGK